MPEKSNKSLSDQKFINTATEDFGDTKYILSLQGGGIRGYSTICFLNMIEEDLQSSSNKSIYEKFDMIGGCSVGGIIASALACGRSTKFIMEIISELMQEANVLEQTAMNFIPLKMKYTGEGKKRMINRIIPHVDMSGNPLYREEKRIKLKPLVIPTYCPYTAKTCYFRTGGSQSLRVVVDASSAAPTYFPPIFLNGEYHVDCGVSINDISMFLYAEARRKWPSSKIKIFNVGTGRFRRKITTGKSPGAYEWFKEGLHHVIANASNDVIDYQCSNLLREDYLHVNCSLLKEIPMDGNDKYHFFRLEKMAHKWYDEFGDKSIVFLDEAK